MKLINTILGAAAALLGTAVYAGEPNAPVSPEDCAPQQAAAPMAEPAPAPKHQEQQHARLTGYGVELEAGGGVGGFLDSRAAVRTSEQGQWTLRGVFGTRRHFGAEVAYIGSAQAVEAVGIDPSAALIGTGFEGAARFNMLTGALQPYAVAGVGWNHYSVTNTTVNTSDVNDRADLMTFPLGAGLAYRIGALVLDARLSFHPTFGTDLIPNANLSTWDLNGKVGFEF